MNPLGRRIALLAVLSSSLAFSAGAARGADWAGWEPVATEDLAATRSALDPDADVEALLWEVWVEDSSSGEDFATVFRHSLRLKIFTERGVEAQKQVEIPYGDDVYISGVKGRTVRPDGGVVELKGSDVFDRTLVKGKGGQQKVKTFALPALAPGVVVEYRWIEKRAKQVANHVDLSLQRDVPVRLLIYHIKPLPSAAEAGYALRAYSFGVEAQSFEPEHASGGFSRVSYRDIPAFKAEPFMGPELGLRRWMLIYYSNDPRKPPATFWREFGRDLHADVKETHKPPASVVAAAQKAVGDAASATEKATRLVRFCRDRIARVDDDAADLTAEQRKKLKRNKTPEDTLASGKGTGSDVMRLFLALAAGAGLDARIIALPDGGIHDFEAGLPDAYLMVARSLAVWDTNRWAFFDPAAMYLPPGMLRWQEEGQRGIVSHPDEPLLVGVPPSEPQKSLARRKATLRLSVDGTLEGEIEEELSGHLGARQKEANDERSVEERRQVLEELIHERLTAAELSEISVENVKQPELPFIRRYHVRVPGFAQRTGRRLFLQPCFFEKGAASLFPSAQRRYPIRFGHAWAEEDEVRIELPPGFELEAPPAPSQLNAAPVAARASSVKMLDARVLEYRRSFHFGGGGQLVFPLESYAALKGFFDRAQQADEHTLTLRAVADAPVSNP